MNLLDWEGSCISSDALDGQPDLGVQQIGELDEANAI
jgi:ubiquitin carboxyl-terminal hydrolase 34